MTEPKRSGFIREDGPPDAGERDLPLRYADGQYPEGVRAVPSWAWPDVSGTSSQVDYSTGRALSGPPDDFQFDPDPYSDGGQNQ